MGLLVLAPVEHQTTVAIKLGAIANSVPAFP